MIVGVGLTNVSATRFTGISAVLAASARTGRIRRPDPRDENAKPLDAVQAPHHHQSVAVALVVDAKLPSRVPIDEEADDQPAEPHSMPSTSRIE